MFDEITTEEWTAYLVDGFWEARLDGFLMGYTTDALGVITLTTAGEEAGVLPADMPRQYVTLVIIYAGIRVLRNKILNTPSLFRAKAGPVEYEQQYAATVLTEMLKQLAATKNRLLEQAELEGNFHSTVVSMFDAYSTRMYEPASYFGSPELAG